MALRSTVESGAAVRAGFEEEVSEADVSETLGRCARRLAGLAAAAAPVGSE
jgi:hypothetical protein